MEQQVHKRTPPYRWMTQLAGGFLFLLFILLGLSVFLLPPMLDAADGTATPMPAGTVTPHILVHVPENDTPVLFDDFSSNKRDWSIYYPNGKLEVIQGSMILQSNKPERYLFGRSDFFDLKTKTYYVQADFSTDVPVKDSYGLIFGLNRSLGSFYMFDIAPLSSSYRLLKYDDGDWQDLIPFGRAEFNPYPQVNILSVYFDEGDIELYANGNRLSSISDPDYFRSASVGVFVYNSGYRLIVDNFYTYEE